jgi:hypothetical protein
MSNSVSNTTISSTPRTSDSGRAQATPDGGGRGRNRNNRNTRNDRQSNTGSNGDNPRPARATTFKGETEGMNGHTFGCFDEQGDKRQFVKTMEALAQYARKTYKFSEDFSSLFLAEPSTPRLDKPNPPPKEDRTETDDLIFREEIKQYVTRCSALKGNLAAIWSVAIGQCTDTMKAKLESLKDFDEKHAASDCHWLLKSILSITLQFDQRRYGHLAIMDAHQKFLSCKQSSNQTVEDFRRQLTLWSDTIEHHGGSIVANYNLTSATDSQGRPLTLEQRKEFSRQETLAMALLRGSDPTRYGTLLDHLANQFASGRDEYPKDLTAAYSLLVHYKTPTNARHQRDNTNNHNSANNTNNRTNDRNAQAAQPSNLPAGGESALTFTQGGGTVSTPVGSVTIPSPPAPVSTPNATASSHGRLPRSVRRHDGTGRVRHHRPNMDSPRLSIHHLCFQQQRFPPQCPHQSARPPGHHQRRLPRLQYGR